MGKVITIAVIGLTIFGLIFYDIFALTVWGVDSTISVVLNDWAFSAHPLLMFAAGMTVGGLIIHFFKWKPE
jgi:hypothetical protein